MPIRPAMRGFIQAIGRRSVARCGSSAPPAFARDVAGRMARRFAVYPTDDGSMPRAAHGATAAAGRRAGLILSKRRKCGKPASFWPRRISIMTRAITGSATVMRRSWSNLTHPPAASRTVAPSRPAGIRMTARGSHERGKRADRGRRSPQGPFWEFEPRVLPPRAVQIERPTPLWRRRQRRSFERAANLAFGMSGQPIEIIGEVDEFVACVVKPHLSCQVPQDFSHAPVFLRFCGRRKIFDHVDFPPNRPNRVENAVEMFEFPPGAGCGSELFYTPKLAHGECRRTDARVQCRRCSRKSRC
jgi:hypothetical protein